MLPTREVAVLLTGAVACTAICSSTAVRIFAGSRRPENSDAMHRLIDRLERSDDRAHEASEARLARLEQAIEAIAVEVERIAEGQRFVTKLLADRSPDRQLRDASPKPERVITPH